MKGLICVCGLLLLWAGTALGQAKNSVSEFRDARLVRIDDPLMVTFESAIDPTEVREAIATAASKYDWKIVAESVGKVELSRRIQNKHQMRVSLVYDSRGYEIRYLDSINLLYNDSQLNMRGNPQRAIHKNYNIWIRELAGGINAVAAVPAAVAKGRRPAATGKDEPALRAPVPEKLDIVAPSPDALPQAAAFSGQWAGTWSSNLHHVLVVQRVEGRNVTLLYCHGTNASVHDASCSRTQGGVGADSVLRGTLGNGAEVRYQVNGDGQSLRGEWERNGRILFGTFQKVAR